MYSQTEQEKELLKKNNPIQMKTMQEFKELSDRELLEHQTIYLFKIEKTNERIKKNVVFFYYAFAVSIAITLLVLASQ